MSDPFNNDDSLTPALRRMYDTYLDGLFKGCTKHEAAYRAGIAPINASDWIRLADTDSYVVNRKKALEADFEASKVWNPAVAVLTLASMVFNDGERGANRIAAIKELNVLCGITEIDDIGRSKLRRTLADFYADQEPKPTDPVAPTLQ